jgi:hypothetical protein
MDEKTVAGIVYNETSGLRPAPGYEKELWRARVYIAGVATIRQGRGLADPKIPNETELKNPLVKQIWEECLAATFAVCSIGVPDFCPHFVIWPSTDGKTPTDTPKMSASWPYTQLGKISNVFGPFHNPKKVGDVPQGHNIYIFAYCGVR